MKAYIQPETTEVLLVSCNLMRVANPSDDPAHPGAPERKSMMLDVPGNKRREL
jgi:hypothetical protein